MQSIFSALSNIFSPQFRDESADWVAKAEAERVSQLKEICKFSASYYVLPLFLFFSLADWIYYRDYFYEFLIYRLFTVISIPIIGRSIQSAQTLSRIQILSTLFVLCCSGPINLMVFRIGDLGNVYYAGLNLVVMGMASGFRVTWSWYVLNVLLTVAPTFLLFPFVLGVNLSSYFWVNAMFVLSTALIATVSRAFNEYLYRKEFISRNQLETEVVFRGAIIDQKTKEAINFQNLSKQFSPQVVQSIREKSLDINRPVHRSEIGVIFVDIVGSTERFIRLDREDLHKILGMFMEDTMSTLLKYDITIDKFLGDGVLGFANDPVKYPDYVERLIMAALEIGRRIELRRTEYEDLWLSDFQVRIGLSTGYATVGFYGSDLYFKSYTAIGSVVNLATRLCSVASPGEILLSHDIVAKLRKRNALDGRFVLQDVGRKELKGFDADSIKIYSVKNGDSHHSSSMFAEVCPKGHGLLYLDTDEKGIYVYRCRSCDYVLVDEILRKKPDVA